METYLENRSENARYVELAMKCHMADIVESPQETSQDENFALLPPAKFQSIFGDQILEIDYLADIDLRLVDQTNSFSCSTLCENRNSFCNLTELFINLCDK